MIKNHINKSVSKIYRTGIYNLDILSQLVENRLFKIKIFGRASLCNINVKGD